MHTHARQRFWLSVLFRTFYDQHQPPGGPLRSYEGSVQSTLATYYVQRVRTQMPPTFFCIPDYSEGYLPPPGMNFAKGHPALGFPSTYDIRRTTAYYWYSGTDGLGRGAISWCTVLEEIEILRFGMAGCGRESRCASTDIQKLSPVNTFGRRGPRHSRLLPSVDLLLLLATHNTLPTTEDKLTISIICLYLFNTQTAFLRIVSL